MAILPDLLAPSLRVVFCGTAPSTKSARVGAYYAGPGNKFWPTLCNVGLTPHQVDPQQYREALTYGIGLTDLVKERAGEDSALSRSDFDIAALRAKIERYAPRALAFTSKRAAKEFYHVQKIGYGQQPEPVGETAVFVLPSPSGAANRYWDESYWQGLADWLETNA